MPSTTRSMKGMFVFYDACPYCGKKLKRINVNLLGKEHEVTCWGSCGCPESAADDWGQDDEYRRYLLAGIPRRYVGAECQLGGNDLAVFNGRSLFITGPNGSGKTFYAACLARHLMDMGGNRKPSLYFTSMPKLVEDIKSTYGGDRNDSLDRAYGSDFLIIDDLGKEVPTRNTLEMLFLLVDARYGDGKPIVVTSNFTRGGLADRWEQVDDSMGSAIASRLCDGCTVVTMDGRDRRLS